MLVRLRQGDTSDNIDMWCLDTQTSQHCYHYQFSSILQYLDDYDIVDIDHVSNT